MPELTSLEWRLVEEWTSLLDYVSRVDQGIDAPNWHYAQDKSRELVRVAQNLDKALREAWKTSACPRRDLVMAEIHKRAAFYRAGRGLYGLDKPPSPFDDLD